MFDPKNQYWGNNIDGLKTDTPYLQDSVANGRWDWAYFGHNDWFPHNREELRNYDPRGFKMIEEVWSAEAFQ